ncbi:MAG: DUF4091 domain-containing protein [Lentisphaeria bacterium]|nr:DUF4091 domain-containing protein [Lentisphaeria bacterium]
MRFEFRFVSALEKVFCRPDFRPEFPLPADPCALPCLHVARGEMAACQLMMKCDENIQLTFRAELPDGVSCAVREVGYVPCDIPSRPGNPDAASALPGLYPDPLLPVADAMRLTFGNWHAVYLTFRVSGNCAPGEYEIPVHIDMVQPDGCPWPLPFDLHETARIRLAVHRTVLAPQKIICTNWFHCDCLARYYGVDLWSGPFWRIAENYWRDMTAHGRTMLYTPLWTPPLDTAIGHERPTTQLLKVRFRDGKFSFDFSVLDAFIEHARKCGIGRFEMSHMFTQWGAAATPKIVVETENGEEKMFGWHVPSDSPAYRDFLSALLPGLCRFLREKGLSGKVYFHISDEPSEKNLAVYRAASELVHKYLPSDEFPVMDALSKAEFARKKLLEIPVPTVSHYAEFEEEPLRERWFYYSGDIPGYPGASFGLPSRRNRIIGVLFYLYRIDGFLHWGHNFWFGQYSLDRDLDPWRCTTAGRAFCGGGSFNVYPGKDGCPVDSLHYEVFTLALQDLRLFQTLEAQIGRDAVVELIHEGLDHRIVLNRFPASAGWLERLHDRLLQKADETLRPEKG